MSQFDDINLVPVEKIHRSGKILGGGRCGCVIEKVYLVTPRPAPQRRSLTVYARACKSFEATEFEDTLLSEFVSQFKSYHKIRHQNLLAIEGICKPSPHTKVPWLLFELMETNLLKLISDEQLPMSLSLHILKEISDGLEFLHRKDIVHGDLSSSSILLNGQNHVKIGGFPFINSSTLSIQVSAEKQAFMAPEVLSDTPCYDKPVDLYSYACIALHLMSYKLPALPKSQLRDVEPGEDIYAVLEGQKDNFNDASPALWTKVVKPCLDFVPASRPLMKSVKLSVKDVVNDHNHRMVIQHSEKVIQAKDAVTIPQFLNRIFDHFPNKPALFWKDEKDSWLNLTYDKYKKLIYNVAKSFVKLGLEPYNSVCILGFNSVEWFASSLGAVFAGGFSTGIHTTSNAEACHHILKDSQARIVVVTNQEFLDKIYKARDKLPGLKVVVRCSGGFSKDFPETYTWNKFLELGKDMEDSVIDKIIDKQQPHQRAMLVYTSGTTGMPKGAMLSHENFTWITEAIMDTIGDSDLAKRALEVIVSYLPLAHIAGMVADLFLPIAVGGRVYFAKPDALKGSLFSTLKEVKPTMFFGVPRIWEQVKDNIIKKMEKMTIGEPNSHPSAIIRKELGLENCVYMFSATTPMCPKTLEFFENIGITILELYGLSECTGPHTASLKTDGQNRWKRGSCGKGINGTKTKIIDKNLYDQLNLPETPHKHKLGEVLLHGRHIFCGYIGRTTTELTDDDGWLHSGDIGWMDDDGYLYVTCRKEDLITMQDGTKISPIKIEDFIKSEVPFLSNVIVLGDKRSYLTCLLTLKCVINPYTGKATDDLQPQVIEKFKELGSNCTTISQVTNSKDEAVYKAIQGGIERYNSCDNIFEAQKIQKWKLLETDFTIPGRELGPTYKVKRSMVAILYAAVIDELYEKEVSSRLFVKLNEHHCFLKDPEIMSDTVNDYGNQITIEAHNITITIPPGAVEKGYIVEIKVGANCFGPLSFPEGYYHCISPCLWIHTEYNFKKLLKVEMEHHAVVCQQEDMQELCILEGIKDDTDDYGSGYTIMHEVNDKSQCKFRLGSSICTYCTRSKYTCLASKSKEIADRVSVHYWLPQSYKSDEKFLAIFHFCYDLKFYSEVTESAYQEQGMIKMDCHTLPVCYNEDIMFHVNDMHPPNEKIGRTVNYVHRKKWNANQLQGFSNTKEFKDACKSESHRSPCFKALIRYYGSSSLLHVNFHITTQKKEKIKFDDLYHPRPSTPALLQSQTSSCLLLSSQQPPAENLEAEQLSEPSSSKNQETKAAEKFEVTSTSATQPADHESVDTSQTLPGILEEENA